MKIWLPQFLVNWIIKRALRTPYFHLKDKATGDTYMERWWLRQPPGHGSHSSTYEKGKSGVGVRVHHIMRSDEDRAFHDHPWWSISIILRGGYWEIVPINQRQHRRLDLDYRKRVWRGPGSIVFRSATDRHRLEIPEGGDAWSLFIMGPWQRDWGFHTRSGWVNWRKYLGIPAGQDENGSMS
jgi:hypothetical protein